MPDFAAWVPSAQATTTEASFTYTVLNAWALAMGLTPNPAFTPNQQQHEVFFIQAQRLFDLALEDGLRWQLLFAFLRCTKFVRRTEEDGEDGNINLPTVRQRFDQSKRTYEDLLHRQAQADTAEEFDLNFDVEYLPLGLEEGLAHNAAFAWDTLTDVQRGEIVHLVREGQWNLQDTADQLRERIEQRRTPPNVAIPPAGTTKKTTGNSTAGTDDTTTSNPPETPCENLRKRLRELLTTEQSATALSNFRYRRSESAELGRWLQGEEADMCVYSVLMAINDLQGYKEGFFIAPYDSIQNAGLEAAARGMRPGRPLIVPYVYEHHIVLLVIQLEDDYTPTMYVLDSMYHYHNRQRHDTIFRNALTSLRNTVWFRQHFGERKINLPKSAIWVRTSQQPTTNECGYYSILNAWGIALGLELNLEATIRWTDEFFNTLRNIMDLARVGHAD
ncbi:hypothetical protein A1F99_131320 [Pyrenophora tritici-repentis]|nr:hypothetical protein A1F99_131320 [Pyrenophora tritici-repentis]